MPSPRQSYRPVVVITGAAGLIGSSLAEKLSGEYQVVGFDIAEPDKLPGDSKFIKCDLTDDSNVAKAISSLTDQVGNNIASVIHLAAYYDFSGDPSPMYDKLTVEGTRRLLQQLQPLSVEQFVFSSSLLVMKSADTGETIDEDSPTEALWDYPQSKVKAERAIHESRDHIPSVVLRVAGVYDEDCNSIPIAQQITRIYERAMESYFFPGNKEHGQPFIHLDDLVNCFHAVIKKRGQLGDEEMFLIAEDELLSYEQLQDEIGELVHGKQWPTIRIPKSVAKAGAWAQEKISGDEEAFIKPWMIDLADTHHPVTIEHARRRLDWSPRHKLSQTLPVMIRRLKDNPKAWYERNGLTLPDGGPDEEQESAGAGSESKSR
ncbi:MAG: NAD(P)-dependent oxidoreductase [Pirellulales bacterium]